jgi:serine/threonine protein kinase
METTVFQIGGECITLPKSFGGYEIVKPIGAGSFSVVLMVTDRHQRSFACKVVSRSFLTRMNIFHRFEQEVRLLEMMHHPNIVSVVEVIYEDALIYVVMEYCSGGELFQFIVDRGRMREHDSRQMFAGLVSALTYMHARGVAHRDVKPENILLDDAFVPKLADFGLCHLVKPDSLMTTPCGSPEYAAPELLSGKSYDGRASDVWSLGVVLFVMATAALPWKSTVPASLFQEIAAGDYRVPGYVSPSLRGLIVQMMSLDPAQRPSIDEIAQHPWLSGAELDEYGLPVVQGIAKAISLDFKVPKQSARRGDGRAMIVRPTIPSAGTAIYGKGPACELEVLLRRVPPVGRTRTPVLQRLRPVQ